ncbi:hypothetical protein ABZN20_14305 [Methylococcus sp. ANG]|uniref:hypothetical protein n=1 Tax=Methylococcus sp. ANG TaxID=3231903 RepID=UPI003457D572
MLKIPAPYYALSDAAAELGVDTSRLLHLAETGQIELCFVFRWLSGSGTVVRYYKEDRKDQSRIIESGELMPGGSALVYLNHWDLLTLMSGERATVEGGIDYNGTDDEGIVYLCWGPATCTIGMDDIRIPAYEVEALKKVGEFYEWVEGFEPVQLNAATDSDAALGRQIRAQRSEFAKRNAAEVKGAREQEWERWRSEAERIQAGRIREASKRKLAELVKKSLNLPDSVETIRKKIKTG